MTSPSQADVRAAMATLEQFFQDRVVPRMILELRSKSVDVRRSAISVPRSAGASAAHAIPALLEVISAEVRQRAVWAIGQLA